MPFEVAGYPAVGIGAFATGLSQGFLSGSEIAERSVRLQKMLAETKAAKDAADAAAAARKASADKTAPEQAPGQAIGAPSTGSATGGTTDSGAGKLGEVVDYTPSDDFLKSTGMTADQYNLFRRHLAGRESQSYGEPPNKEGYMGRYQMGPAEIQESANRLGIPVPSQSQFLANPQLQEQLFENYTLAHHNELMNNPTYANASPTERAAILAGAHLGGVTGVNNYLATGKDPADRLGTHISSYVSSMRGVMSAPTTTADTTPTTPPVVDTSLTAPPASTTPTAALSLTPPSVFSATLPSERPGGIGGQLTPAAFRPQAGTYTSAVPPLGTPPSPTLTTGLPPRPQAALAPPGPQGITPLPPQLAQIAQPYLPPNTQLALIPTNSGLFG